MAANALTLRRVGLERPARLVAAAFVLGISATLLIFSLRGIGLEDIASYWGAAERIRDGQPLYLPLGSTAQFYAVNYAYAPWFAYAWVPLTYLPQPVAVALWEMMLVGAGAWLLWRLRDQPLALALFGVLLFDTISEGNVQTLMVAMLAWGIDRRSGPLWVGIAASLKGFPILLALLYVRRREWRRAALAVAVTGALWAPALLFDWREYPVSVGRTLLWGTPLYWPVAVGAVAYAALFAARRYQRLAAAAAVIAVMPRFWLYDATMLLVGLRAR